MELFSKEYVYFMWDEELNGKNCMVSDSIKTLINAVNTGNVENICSVSRVKESIENEYPFETQKGCSYKFAYYDPNYECKIAYDKGKTIQRQTIGTLRGEWLDIYFPTWSDGYRYRVKPENEWVKFETLSELICAWKNKYPETSLCQEIPPTMWFFVKYAGEDSRILTKVETLDFGKTITPIYICNEWWSLKRLFNDCLFPDKTPVGKKVE